MTIMKNGSKPKELKLGIRCGNLIIIKEVESKIGKTKSTQGYDVKIRMVECLCDCGNTTIKDYRSLFKCFKKGQISSCGCLKYKVKGREFDIDPNYGNLSEIEKIIYIENLLKDGYRNIEISRITGRSAANISLIRTKLGLKLFTPRREAPVGEVFGRLTVLRRVKVEFDSNIMCECVCECGTKTIVRLCRLLDGATKSCGCYAKEVARGLMVNNLIPNNTKHADGIRTSPFYYLFSVWMGAKQRCYNPNNKRYSTYGERGITMYESWINDYPAFKKWVLENIGEKPEGSSKKRGDSYSLDRINVNKGYEPGNLKWSTFIEQMNNKSIHTLGHITKPKKREEGFIVPESPVYTKIYEDHYGVQVKKGNVIHHIDWDGSNNDPSNLIEVTREEHGWLHRTLQYELRNCLRDEIIDILRKRNN